MKSHERSVCSCCLVTTSPNRPGWLWFYDSHAANISKHHPSRSLILFCRSAKLDTDRRLSILHLLRSFTRL